MSIPGSVNPLFLGASAAESGYQISRSLRFNSADSAYLSRTPASSSNRKTWTWAGWVKRSALSYGIFEAGTTNNITTLVFSTTSLMLQDFQIGVINWTWTTSAVFRDFSAWYHIVVSYDTTQASSANTVKIYVNGVEQTITFSTNSSGAYSQNRDSYVNSTSAHRLGTYNGVSNFADMYLADVHLVDGQVLDPTSFGEFDDNGIWQPIRYTGTYGTNGFHLDFRDNSAATATALGKDSSGNGNNWTPNNLSVTAGAGNDSLVDVPTNGSQTDTGAGGEVRGNYATWNPLKRFNVNVALANGNLDTSVSQTASTEAAVATFALPTTGKWYWEITLQTYTNASADVFIGVGTLANATQNTASNLTSGGGYYRGNGTITNLSNSAQTSGGTWSQGDIIGIAVDVGAGTAQFYKNNVAQGATPSFSFTAGTELVPYIANDNSANAKVTNANFGQRPFAYTAPSGFKALCTANLPAPTIEDGSTVMDVALYAGNGSTQSISGLAFSPDFVWIKERSSTSGHLAFDVVRGPALNLVVNATDAEATASTQLTSFDSNGFTTGPSGGTNESGQTYVAWTWDAGSNTVTNNDGTISSQVRANPSAGFSIVKYNGTSANATIGHGLGIAPQLIIRKYTNDTDDWYTYHASAGTDKYFSLNRSTEALSSTSIWQNTAPTSSVFYIGAGNNNSNSIAYCFAPVAGYSSFGSYTSSYGTDGPFVYLGFRPRWLMIRASTTTASWVIWDTARAPYNVFNYYAPYANGSAAEDTFSGYELDILSNGFKCRGGNDQTNPSPAQTVIYAAFAENPFALNARAR